MSLCGHLIQLMPIFLIESKHLWIPLVLRQVVKQPFCSKTFCVVLSSSLPIWNHNQLFSRYLRSTHTREERTLRHTVLHGPASLWATWNSKRLKHCSKCHFSLQDSSSLLKLEWDPPNSEQTKRGQLWTDPYYVDAGEEPRGAKVKTSIPLRQGSHFHLQICPYLFMFYHYYLNLLWSLP